MRYLVHFALTLLLPLPACLYPEILGDNPGTETSEAETCSSGACAPTTVGGTTCDTDACAEPTTAGECESGGCDSTTDTCESGPCDDSTTGTMPLTNCPPGAGNLSLLWNRTDPRADRGEAVAVGLDRVAWTAGGFAGSQLRALDLDGEPLWEASVPVALGEGEQTYKDLTISDAGTVVLVGQTLDGDGTIRLFAADGGPLGGHVEPGASYGAIRQVGDGTLLVAGAATDALFVQRFAADGAVMWSQTDEEGSSWASDVAILDQEVFVSGHSSQHGGPVLFSYALDGTPHASAIFTGVALEVSHGLAVDSTGDLRRIVYTDDGGRLEHLDANGNVYADVQLDFWPRALAIDADDNVVVVGRDPQQPIVVIERRSKDDVLLARQERPGSWGLAVDVDPSCHAYVVGVELDGAWLDALN